MFIENGGTFVLEGPASGVHYMTMVLPSEIGFGQFPYLTLRARATKGAQYCIRPSLDGVPAYDNAKTVGKTALEARKGKGSAEADWEIVTLNMRTLHRIYQPPATTINCIDLVIGPNPLDPPAQAAIRLEVDYIGVHAGIPPDTLLPEETDFTDGLDDDGDGLVDRDDEHFRDLYPKSVLVNYQSLWASLSRGGWKGKRKPGAGQSGPELDIDPGNFSSSVPGKRHIPSTYYPLDYVANPDYEPPSNYNEFAEQNQAGIWPGCSSLTLPPTEQFPGLNYDALGAVEEYDDCGANWLTAQASLAKRYAIDGFIHDDGDIGNSNSSLGSLTAMAGVLDGLGRGAWARNPFRMASFYGVGPLDPDPTKNTAQSIVSDLTNIIGTRTNMTNAYFNYRGKPVVFIYPMYTPFRYSSAQWEEIFQGLRQPDTNDFDGAFCMPAASPGGANSNVLKFQFSAYQNDGVNAFSGHIDYIEWYDHNMRLSGKVDFGKTDTRSLYMNGFSADVPPSATEPFDYTFIMGRTGTVTEGAAQMHASIPANAFYMKLSIKGLDQAMTGQPVQRCTMSVNGQPGITFTERVGWSSYLFRLRDLPAGFEEAGSSDAPLAELPASLWGQDESLVRRLNDTNRARGFDGLAHYTSIFQDLRVDVSFPYLRADTVRPSFDDSGQTYFCTARPHFRPRNGGLFYRQEWEQLIADNPDMAIVTSWNEFAEGTNIEPDIEHGFDPLRLTMTYALIYKGFIETDRLPSATNLKVTRFDTDGDERTIEFSIAGSDSVRFRGLRFGLDGNAISGIMHNGSPVALHSAEAPIETGVLYPSLTINTPPGQSSYRISYRDSSTAGASRADVALGFAATPNPAAPGGQITYSITARNFGPAMATNVSVACLLPPGCTFLSVTNPSLAPSGNSLIGTIGDLAPGASANIGVAIAAPSSGAIAHAEGSILANETDPNTENNCRTAQTFIGIPGSVPTPGPTPAPEAGSDLTLSWAKLSQVCAAACKLKGKIIVTNFGTEKARPSRISFYLSQDGTLGEGDTFLNSVMVGAIRPGKSKAKLFRVKLPQTASGEYVIAVADEAQLLAEIDERNNIAAYGPVE